MDQHSFCIFPAIRILSYQLPVMFYKDIPCQNKFPNYSGETVQDYYLFPYYGAGASNNVQQRPLIPYCYVNYKKSIALKFRGVNKRDNITRFTLNKKIFDILHYYVIIIS